MKVAKASSMASMTVICVSSIVPPKLGSTVKIRKIIQTSLNPKSESPDRDYRWYSTHIHRVLARAREMLPALLIQKSTSAKGKAIR